MEAGADGGAGTASAPAGRPEGGQRFGVADEDAFGAGHGALDGDAGGDDAGQEVGAGVGAQFALHRGQAVDGRAAGGEVLAEGGQAQPGRGDARIGGGVVVAVHGQHGPVRVPGAQGLGEGGQPVGQRLGGAAEQVGGVAVPAGQVLGADGAAVRAGPREGGAVDAGGHAAPEAGVLEPGQPEDLRHLGAVAELVGQVADAHRAAERLGAAHAVLEVADEGLARAQELVGEDEPRTGGEAALGDEGLDQRPAPGPHLQVVLQRGELTVHGEAVGGVGGQGVEDPVERADQSGAEPLEGQVPFAVPVGVRDDGDLVDPGDVGVRRHGLPLVSRLR